MQIQLLLLEGVCGAGKTTVCAALQELDCGREIVVLDQHFTYAPLVSQEDAGTLDNAKNLAFLQQRIRVLSEMLSRECKRPRIVILDTFHITQHLRPGVLTIESFHRVDASLKALQCRASFLWVDEKTLMQRTIVGRRNTGFERYAQKFGKTEAEVHAHFCQEQNSMWELSRNESQLIEQRLDASRPPSVLAKAIVAHALLREG